MFVTTHLASYSEWDENEYSSHCEVKATAPLLRWWYCDEQRFTKFRYRKL